MLAYALTIKVKGKKTPATNGTALKWDATCTKSSTPLIMNEKSQSQLTVFHQLFSSRNTCEKVPHRRLCSGKSLHSKPSAAFCECEEGRTAAIGFFKSNVHEKRSESASFLVIDPAREGAETHCKEMELETCKWCAGVLKKVRRTMCCFHLLSVGNYLHISSRPTGLWSCSRSGLQWHHSSERELTWHLSGWKASF